MNLMLFLDDRLGFSQYLYDSTVPGFAEIMRKVEAGEPPFADCRHPEDESSDAPYQDDWEKADLAVDVIAMSCLALVQNALHAYLIELLKEIGGDELLNQVSTMSQGSWLANYRALFATDPDFDWSNSGADLELLEEMVLTRNSFSHPAELTTPYTFQTNQHAVKYPGSRFRDPHWPASFFRNSRLHVTRERLEASILAVRTLCSYLAASQRKRRQKLS